MARPGGRGHGGRRSRGSGAGRTGVARVGSMRMMDRAATRSRVPQF
ncbi:hypothetical protein OH687_20985 [Burkholderia anthina]|nr:hypothetical protein OH687_20985 [Burkholderia anthina]